MFFRANDQPAPWRDETGGRLPPVVATLLNDRWIQSAIHSGGFQYQFPSEGQVTVPATATAGAAYDATAQTMLQTAYDKVRDMLPPMAATGVITN